ncbi:unnamed protein product [Camellia sinensis]
MEECLRARTVGKLFVEKIKEVAEVQEKGRFSNDLLIDAFPSCAQLIPTTGSLGEITSARNMEKVWEYLMDDEVRRIGIYGMGEVGKTTIMHHINNRFLNETCNVGDVIWVTVSKAFNVRNLQRQIIEALDLDLSNYADETRRASEIYTMLSQKKRHVLILDDLWETFPLEYCWQLEYVPSLEKLKALKELKLTESQIEEVPQGLEELSNLRNLDLSQATYVFFLGLLCLTQLKVLGAQFHNVQELTSFVTSQQCQSLENYHVMVGNVYKNDRDDIQEDYFAESKEICTYDSKLLRSTGVDLLVLPCNKEILEIRRCHYLISLMDIQLLRDARDLRICEIRDCNGIESIFSLSSFSEGYHTPLRRVEELWFSDLPNLRVLFDGVIPPCNISFNLKELYFYRCPRIKIIFPAKFLQKFPNFEELVVCDCENVEDIMVEAEMSDWGNHQDDSNTVILPNFKILKLENLPRPRAYVRQVSAPPALRSIGGEEEWWESLEWDDPHTKTTLQPLFFRIQDVCEEFCELFGLQVWIHFTAVKGEWIIVE